VSANDWTFFVFTPPEGLWAMVITNPIHVTQSVCQVVLRKSIPTQIRQVVIYCYLYKE
jgi:hypothetical protein